MQLQSEQQSLLLTVIQGNEFSWKTLPTVFFIQMIAEGYNVFFSKVSLVFQLILLFEGGLILISDLWILLGPGSWRDFGCIPPRLFSHYPF